MDAEIQAMAALSEALANLESDAQARVLTWASQRFGVSPLAKEEPDPASSSNDRNTAQGCEAFADLAELFAAANPSVEAEKVLVAAYWFQQCQGHTELKSLDINKALKDLGHGISKMNREFDRLIDRKPQWALQVKRSGDAKRGRKTYRLTSAGIGQVEEMLQST